MSSHKATIRWNFTGDVATGYAKGKYSREHTWIFDGGVSVAASSSPSVVPAPWSNPANVDPEEAYVASLSSCHMLTFLHLARLAGFALTSYEDDAVGELTKNDAGAPWISTVTLSPRIVWAGDKRPTPEEEAKLHDGAHHGCFIANSVKTTINVRPAD